MRAMRLCDASSDASARQAHILNTVAAVLEAAWGACPRLARKRTKVDDKHPARSAALAALAQGLLAQVTLRLANARAANISIQASVACLNAITSALAFSDIRSYPLRPSALGSCVYACCH
jgi:hypothetical protein